MKLSILNLAAVTWLVAGAAWTAPRASVANPISGAEYKFRDPPLNSLGVKSLADLRGKPVVIDFWGRN
jgi:hypothetical protein